jgi:hypothetical protein
MPTQEKPRKMRRTVTGAGSKTITFICPEKGVSLVEEAVRQQGTDFSKFVRAALKEKLQRLGHSEEAAMAVTCN